jgi:hypothetical protein
MRVHCAAAGTVSASSQGLRRLSGCPWHASDMHGQYRHVGCGCGGLDSAEVLGHASSPAGGSANRILKRPCLTKRPTTTEPTAPAPTQLPTHTQATVSSCTGSAAHAQGNTAPATILVPHRACGDSTAAPESQLGVYRLAAAIRAQGSSRPQLGDARPNRRHPASYTRRGGVATASGTGPSAPPVRSNHQEWPLRRRVDKWVRQRALQRR